MADKTLHEILLPWRKQDGALTLEAELRALMRAERERFARAAWEYFAGRRVGGLFWADFEAILRTIADEQTEGK